MHGVTYIAGVPGAEVGVVYQVALGYPYPAALEAATAMANGTLARLLTEKELTAPNTVTLEEAQLLELVNAA